MRRDTRRRGAKDLVRGGIAVLLLATLCLALVPSFAIAQPTGTTGKATEELEMGEERVEDPAGSSRRSAEADESMTPAPPATAADPASGSALSVEGAEGSDEALAPDGGEMSGDAPAPVVDEVALEAQGAARNFPDVPAGAWYAGVVSRAAGLGLINGYPNGLFGPADRITRGQVTVILWNMANKPYAGGGRYFSDVSSGAYYSSAVSWASSVGVVNGYSNGRFGPDDPVTREQLASMIASYARVVAGWNVMGSTVDFQWMTDAVNVSTWAFSSVGWCCRNGVLNGSNSQIRPLGNATRAEAAKMVVSLYDLLRSGQVSNSYTRARDTAMAQGKQVLEGTVYVVSARRVAELDMNPSYNAYSDAGGVPRSINDFGMPRNYDWDGSTYAILMLDNSQRVPGKQLNDSVARVCRYILLGTNDIPGYSFSERTTSRWNAYSGKRTCIAGSIWYPSGLQLGLTASMGLREGYHDAQILYTR